VATPQGVDGRGQANLSNGRPSGGGNVSLALFRHGAANVRNNQNMHGYAA